MKVPIWQWHAYYLCLKELYFMLFTFFIPLAVTVTPILALVITIQKVIGVGK